MLVAEILELNGVFEGYQKRKIRFFMLEDKHDKSSLSAEVENPKDGHHPLEFELSGDANKLFTARGFPINGRSLQRILDTRSVLRERSSWFDHNLDEMFQ